MTDVPPRSATPEPRRVDVLRECPECLDAIRDRYAEGADPVDVLPSTKAGKALVEWAENADPKQVHIWREHALLIEAEARSVPQSEPPALDAIRAILDKHRSHKANISEIELVAELDAALRPTPEDEA